MPRPQNPNLPTLQVAVYPVDPPASGAVPASSPTYITDRVKTIATSRGRQYEMDSDQTGTCALEVVNTDGLLSPTRGLAGLKVMNPVQVSATWAGVTYNLFTGYANKWAAVNPDPAFGLQTVSLTDLMLPLAGRQLRTIMSETILQLGPSWYAALDDPQGSTSVANQVPGVGPSPVQGVVQQGWTLTAIGSGLGATGLAVNDGGSGFEVNNRPDANPQSGQQIQVYGRQNPTGVQVDVSQPWSFACIYKANPQVVSGNTTDANLMGIGLYYISGTIALALNGYGSATGQTQLYMAVGNPANNLQGYSASSGLVWANHNVGPQFAACGWDGTTYWYYDNLQVHYLTNYGGTFTLPTSANDGTSIGTWMDKGLTGSSLNTGQDNGDVVFQHAAFFPYSLSASQVNTLYEGMLAFPGETADARIARTLGWNGITLGASDVGGSPLAAQVSTSGTAMVDAIRATASDDLGRVFIDGSGSPRFFGRYHQSDYETPQAVLGSLTGSGEWPYTGSPELDDDQQRIVNDVQVTTPAGLARATDSASQASYFQQVLQITLDLPDTTSGLSAAQWLLGWYKQPGTRVGAIMLDPSSNPSMFPTVLGLELGQVVQLNHRTITAGTTSLVCVVDQVNHQVDAEAGTWQTMLQLTPLPPLPWLLASSHGTLTAHVSVGATTLTVSPLVDAAINPAEASWEAGTVLQLEPGAGVAELVTVASCVSNPTPLSTGYTSITVTLTAGTVHAHSVGATVCDPLPSGHSNPSLWDVGNSPQSAYAAPLAY